MSEGLSREDLFMFMELYRTTSSANTTLLEQQKILLEKQNKLIQELTETNSSLENVSDSLEAVSDRLDKTFDSLTSFHTECAKNHVAGKGDLSLEHSKITNKIYVTYGIMGGIILALISMIIGLSDKFELIEAIAKTVGAG